MDLITPLRSGIRRFFTSKQAGKKGATLALPASCRLAMVTILSTLDALAY